MSIDKFGRHSSGQIYVEPGVSVRFVNNSFLKRDGSNDVTGDISFNNNGITGLREPIDARDASTKNYTDTKVSRSGDAMSGLLNMNGNRISNLADPIEGKDAATRSYVKAFTRNNVLKLDGTNSPSQDISFNNKKIMHLADPTGDRDASTKAYADTKVDKSGDVMSGILNMNNNQISNLADPTHPLDGVNEQYVRKSIGVRLEERYIIHLNGANGIPSQQPDDHWFEEYAPPTDARDGVEMVRKRIDGVEKDGIRLFYYLDEDNAGYVTIMYRNPEAVLAEMNSNGFTLELRDFSFTEVPGTTTYIYIGNGVKRYEISMRIGSNFELTIAGSAVRKRKRYRDITMVADANFGSAVILVDDEYLTSINPIASDQKVIQFFGSGTGTRKFLNYDLFFSEIIIRGPIPTVSGRRIVDVGNPIRGTDCANKLYVDTKLIRNPIITIWGQRSGSLTSGNYEFSFGSGRTPDGGGICLPFAGRILRSGVTYISNRILLTANRPDFIHLANVAIDSVNRCEINVVYGSTKSHASFPAVDFAAGAVINIQSTTTDLRAICTTISLNIELNIEN